MNPARNIGLRDVDNDFGTIKPYPVIGDNGLRTDRGVVVIGMTIIGVQSEGVQRTAHIVNIDRQDGIAKCVCLRKKFTETIGQVELGLAVNIFVQVIPVILSRCLWR